MLSKANQKQKIKQIIALHVMDLRRMIRYYFLIVQVESFFLFSLSPSYQPNQFLNLGSLKRPIFQSALI